MKILNVIGRVLPLMMMLMPQTVRSQQYFTLEDLIPGGGTYRNTCAENIFGEWWGDKYVVLGVDKIESVDNADGSRTTLAMLDNVNSVLSREGYKGINHMYYVTFPYADKPLAAITTGGKHILYNWENSSVDFAVDAVSGAENADWNWNSRAMAYTKEHNLYVLTADNNIQQVSSDGSLDIVYGESVHRNEFGIEKGTFWSPKGNLLAFYRMDQSMVATYPQVDISTRISTLVPDKYPMAGETSHKVSVGVYSMESHSVVYLETGDPTDRYFTNIAWSPDEKCLYVIELNRDQTDAALVEYDASTGKRLRVVLQEHNDKYIEPLHPIQFLPWDSGKFVYISRNGGYKHIYLYDKSGKKIRQLTEGNYEVIDILGFSAGDKSVVYTSNQANPLQKNVYAAGMNGKNRILGNATGYHTAVLSESGSYVYDSYSSPVIPHNADIISVKDGKVLNLLTSANPLDKYKMPEIRTGSLKAADGTTDLYYRIILPTDFDPSKKYPAVVYVYGGPHAHNVDASFRWGARGWDLWMAQKGYVMFSIDNRGSENRGLDFEQATFRHLGVEEMKDQIAGVDYLKSLAYVDSERIGVHGWSFGGFMTTSLMTTYPDVFKVGVAGGPVIDWKYYEVMYGERYMDTPQANPEGYAETSLLGKADKLKGKLLVIYGGNDDVCVPQHTLSFIRACIDEGTYPDLFTYPGDGHNMMGADRVHLHEKITRYFDDYLK